MFDQCFVPCSFEHPGSSQLAWLECWEGKLTRDKGQGARGNSVVSGGNLPTHGGVRFAERPHLWHGCCATGRSDSRARRLSKQAEEEGSHIIVTTTLSLEGRQVARHDGLKGWLLARRYALAGMALVLVSGMAYSFFWRPLHGQSGWATPPDVWTFYAGAHLVGHGDLGGVFAPGTALANFPAFLVLAPAAGDTSDLGLSYASTLLH